MSKKLKIAQAENCVIKGEQYIDGLDAIIMMCEVVRPFSQYNQMPDEFKTEQRQDMQTIIADLKSMRNDTRNLVASKKNKIKELHKNG